MEKIGDNIISAAVGTTMMTTFSYLVSLLERENFSEPDHLATLINRVVPGTSKNTSVILGWTAHYIVGILFIATYQKLWATGKIKKNIPNAIILGFLSGLVGVGIWKVTLKNQPTKPSMDLTKYLLQLIPAHIILAVGATLASHLTSQSAEIKNN